MAPRPEVEWFAGQMEAQLRKNEHKGGWYGDGARSLFTRLKEEATELDYAIDGAIEADIIKECADVANFAMMIADQIRSGRS